MAPQPEDEDERDRRMGDAEQPLLVAETPPAQGPSTLLTVCPFILGTSTSSSQPKYCPYCSIFTTAFEPIWLYSPPGPNHSSPAYGIATSIHWAARVSPSCALSSMGD